MNWKACRHLLVFSSGEKNNDKLGSQLAIILGCFALVGENDNKPPNLLLFCFSCRRWQWTSWLIVVLFQLQKMTICLPTRCFLHFFLQVKKTMTSWEVHHHLLVFFIRCRIWQWTKILAHCYPWLFVSISEDDNKPPVSLSFPTFLC